MQASGAHVRLVLLALGAALCCRLGAAAAASESDTAKLHPQRGPSLEEIRRLYPRQPPQSSLLIDNPVAVDANATLRSLAAKHGLYMGSASNQQALQQGGTYVRVLAAQYNLVTAENACKWSPTEPQEGKFDLSDCHVVRDAAAAADATMRGHNLGWGDYNPRWLTHPSGGKNFSASELAQLLQSHTKNVAGAFAGDSGVVCWDVVNEAFNDGGVKPMDPWSNLPNYLDVAFYAAAAVLPKSQQLFYNDYGAEPLNAKAKEIIRFLGAMLKRGVRVQGVGLQMHVSTSYYPSPSDVTANMDQLAALGLDVHITEMDVECEHPCNATTLRQQAFIYGQLLKACLQHPACKSFETWGFTDAHTWRGQAAQPLPFDKNYKPKPAFAEMVQVLATTKPVQRRR